MRNKLIEINNLNAGYANKVILENISISIFEKDFIGIIGPNGGGKTSFAKILLGTLKPFSGKIIFSPSDNKRLEIGYLPQINRFDTKFPISVQEVVLSGLLRKKSIKRNFNREEKKSASKLLEQFGISDLKKESIGELSGGQMQRAFLCRALIKSPEILLLDEPNTFVDSNFEKELYQILTELNKELTIILITHDVGTIFSYVKSIACINRSMHYHPTNEITNELLTSYNCPIDLITHGTVPHRVLQDHEHKYE